MFGDAYGHQKLNAFFFALTNLSGFFSDTAIRDFTLWHGTRTELSILGMDTWQYGPLSGAISINPVTHWLIENLAKVFTKTVFP